ncbi:MAG TPA: carbohydrate binding family 9 domain-containing protein [Bacteroidota bacterium]
MTYSRYSGLALFCVAACYTVLSAFDMPDTAKPVIRAVRINQDIHLTGKLDDPRWNLAQPIELRYEVTPGENVPAPQRTFVRMLYNQDYVYFGFDCKDTNVAALRAHITDRDKMFDDDFVDIILDTYGDYQRAYEIVTNPYGIQGDLLMTSNNEDPSFDMVWDAAASINSDGWTAEIAVPFKSLRFPSVPVQQWGVDFIRTIPRASRVQISWTPISRDNPCLLCQGGFVGGISNVQSVTSVDLLPYVVSQQSGGLNDNTDPNSPFHNGKVNGRVGGGLRYSPSPDLAVEGVINPDFSQVESDATQISVNSNFALFYPEKRPFFLLGADIFQNQTQTFYTRTINNPLGAGRVIGKSGSLSFAYLAASDRNTPFIVPGEETSDYVATNLESISNIARARYEFGQEAFLGGMLETRNTGPAHNYLGGVDWMYKFWENYYFQGEFFYADTKEVNDTTILSNSRLLGNSGHDATFNGEQYGGSSALLTLRKNARDYSFTFQYMDRAPTFQAQDGFVPNNDLRTAVLQQNYQFYPNNAWIDSWGVGLNSGLHFNHDGVRKEKFAVPFFYAQFKGQTNVNVTYMALNDELYKGFEFTHINRGELSIFSRPASFLTLQFEGWLGRFIKRNDNPDAGKGHTIDITATVKPTSQFEIDLSYSRARLSSIATGELFYDGYIARTVGIYQFTPEVFLRLIGQYDEFNKAVNVFPLVSYKLNPYTIFYIGSTYDLADFGNPYGFKETSRQYFLKLQYLFRS